MPASEVTSLCNVVIRLASTIQETGNNWYRASADWVDFQRKVDSLRRKYDFWLQKFTQYGMLSETSLMWTLREAQASLEQEQKALFRRQSKCTASCWGRLSRTIFPAQIGLRMQQVIDAFDAIPAQLQMEQDADRALNNRVMRRSASLTIRNDDRYVRLRMSESKVFSALDDPHGPSVVLLHGGAGKGKSTLARHVAQHYQQATPPTLFDRVVFLACGPKADPLTKQFELLHLLGPGASVSKDQERDQISSEVAIPRQLSSLLKFQKVLIIFDDICEGEFLKRMINSCGIGVKCLVTSQKRNLCLSLSLAAIQIQIEDIEQEVAIRILANHVGFGDKHIPKHIQGVMQDMVKEAQGNPLTLASIATAIGYDRSKELEVWEAASRNFLTLLHSEDTAHIDGEKYSKSFWAAMRLSVQSLKDDARMLLLLVHMCAGPAVPEEVLQVLYVRVVSQGSGSGTFNQSRKELENRELVRITSFEKRRSWSMHSLQKLFIEEEMRDRIESMLSLLAGKADGTNTGELERPTMTEFQEDDNARVQVALCALYFDKHLGERVAANHISLGQLNNLRRSAIEPITRLLGQPLSERWTTVAKSSTKQIFLKYIYNRTLHNKGILHILALSISVLPMLNALHDMATVEPTGFVDADSRGLMRTLGNLLEHAESGYANVLAKASARAIWQLSIYRSHIKIIISSGILDAIVRVLSAHDSDPDLQVILVNILARFGDELSEVGAKGIIVQNPGSLAVLVERLFSDDYIPLQIAATRAVGSLASGIAGGLAYTEFAKHKIIHFPGALEQLINLFSKPNTPQLQIEAAKALDNLTYMGEQSNLEMVINAPRALEQLARALSRYNNHSVFGMSYHAAGTIANLSRLMLLTKAEDLSYFKQKFHKTEGLMDGLLGLLASRVPPSTQGRAVMALTFLDPKRGNGARLHFATAYAQRGKANMYLGFNKESLEDLNKADMMEAGDLDTLNTRIAVRARLGDFEGALADSNRMVALLPRSTYQLRERGILKRRMKNLPGALADLNKALGWEPNDYEALKHRGYVRYLMKDENGARADAEMALRVNPNKASRPAYGRHSLRSTTYVEFLDYKLK